MYEYAPEALEQLAGHGLRPGPGSRPALVREALSDLYRYEIRRLRQRLLAGDIPREAYSGHVIALRRQVLAAVDPRRAVGPRIVRSLTHQNLKFPDRQILLDSALRPTEVLCQMNGKGKPTTC